VHFGSPLNELLVYYTSEFVKIHQKRCNNSKKVKNELIFAVIYTMMKE